MKQQPNITGLILAGGQSRRMGTNKALLELNGQTLVEHAIDRLQPQVTQLLVSTNTPLELVADIPQLADAVHDAGPLGGILTGLLWLRHQSEETLPERLSAETLPERLEEQLQEGPEQQSQNRIQAQQKASNRQQQQAPPASAWLLTVAVDTPLFPHGLAQQLWQCAATDAQNLKIIAARSDHREHPTFALWHTDLIPVLSHYLLEEKQRRLMTFIGQQPHRYVDFPAVKNRPGSTGLVQTDPFENLNDPQALSWLIQRIASECTP